MFALVNVLGAKKYLLELNAEVGEGRSDYLLPTVDPDMELTILESCSGVPDGTRCTKEALI